MSFSFSSLIRLLVLLVVGTTMLAVGLSKLDPRKPGWRTRRPTSFTNINEYFLDVTDRTPRWLDSDTGQVTANPLVDGDVLEAASCAPWVDEKGHQQVAGRWSSRTKEGPMSMSNDFGLARYSFPEGRMIDKVSTEIVPVGPPCWFPGIQARVLFAAGDGMLYHFAFEAEPWAKEIDPKAKGDLQPAPLVWRCDKPGVGNVFLSDMTWPEDPRLGGCLVVALREQYINPGGTRRYSRNQLWWLKLNFAGTEIVEAGRLLEHDAIGSISDQFDERSPTVGVLPNGKLVLIYLRQQANVSGWDLCAAPIGFDSDHHRPRVSETESTSISVRCQPSHPTISTDGKWLNAINGPSPSESRVVRISTAQLFQPTR